MRVRSSRKGAGHDTDPGASRGHRQRMKEWECANHPGRGGGVGRGRGYLRASIIFRKDFQNILKNPQSYYQFRAASCLKANTAMHEESN